MRARLPLQRKVLPELLRFPAFFALSAGAAVFAALGKDKFCHACIWAALLSCTAQLAAEAYGRCGAKARRLMQPACALCAVPCFFLLRLESARIEVACAATGCAMLALCPFLLRHMQDDKEIVLNISCAALTSFLIMMCVGCALSIISLACSTLLLSNIALPAIWSFSFFVVFAGSFLSLSCRRHEEIRIPALCKAVFLYTLFPLYLLLLAVLYVYLARSIFTLSLPMKEANLFISTATALYLLFRLTLPYYGGKAVRLFQKYGAAVLIPLVIMQCVISADRIHAHGGSPERYASVLYTTYTIIVLALSFRKSGRHMLCACPVLAALCLLAGIPPVGIVDVPLRSQTKIMERILDSHGLIRDGAVDSARAAQELSPEEKKDIDRAFGKLTYFAVYPAWCKGGYEAIFSAAAMQKYRCDVSVPQDTAVDIARYEQLYPVQADGTLLLFAGASFDAEQEIRARLRPENQAEKSGEPIVIRTEDGFTLVLTYVSATLSVSSEKELKDKPFSRAVTIRGFACR